MIYLLKGKSNLLSPTLNNSVQGALIKIAQLLHGDKTPRIIPISLENLSSEGKMSTAESYKKSVASFEYVDFISTDKSTLNPIIPHKMVRHPLLYSTRHIREPAPVLPLRSKIKRNPNTVTPSKMSQT